MNAGPDVAVVMVGQMEVCIHRVWGKESRGGTTVKHRVYLIELWPVPRRMLFKAFVVLRAVLTRCRVV
jgi:hypothetical protein